MPYIFSQAVKATQTGIPMMRPMVMEFPEDPLCFTLDKQYMLGDSLLVAPVFFEDGHCDVYLPNGKFTYLFTSVTIQGGRLISETYDYFSLPVYVKENSLIAIGRNDTAEYDYHIDVTIYAYNINIDNVTDASIKLYDKTGTWQATVTAKYENEDITFDVEGDAPGIQFKIIQ